jgi:hypothetical protein
LNADVSLAIGDRGLRSYAIALAITQLVEVPIYVLALKSRRGPRTTPRSWAMRVAIGFGASALTHPIVWFVMPAVWTWLYVTAVGSGAPHLGVAGRTLGYGALAEGFAVLAEGLYLRAFGVRRAGWWAAGANAASVVVGTAVVWGLG